MTLELALRRWIRDQAGIDVGYVEQLYTFGDLARISDQEPDGPRAVSIAYVALAREESPAPRAEWVDCYELLPWEDHSDGRPQAMADIENGLARWDGILLMSPSSLRPVGRRRRAGMPS